VQRNPSLSPAPSTGIASLHPSYKLQTVRPLRQRRVSAVCGRSGALPARCAKTLISYTKSTRFAPSSPFRKNNVLLARPKSALSIPPSHPSRGADRDRHGRGVGCGGRGSVRRVKMFAGRLFVSGHGAQDVGAEAYGKTVWFWHPWLVSSCRWRMRSNRIACAIKPAAMEARGIRLQGELGISRQTIAQGMPACPGCTCMLVCASTHNIAHETAGAASTRHSLLPPS
jgi:hypothetical protein